MGKERYDRERERGERVERESLQQCPRNSNPNNFNRPSKQFLSADGQQQTTTISSMQKDLNDSEAA